MDRVATTAREWPARSRFRSQAMTLIDPPDPGAVRIFRVCRPKPRSHAHSVLAIGLLPWSRALLRLASRRENVTHFQTF